MILIDTHAHIYQEDFDADIDLVIERAQKEGVERILLPNIDADTIEKLHLLADKFPTYCLPMMGLHPTSVNDEWMDQLLKIKSQFQNRRYIAVGEIGLDLYWDKTYQKEQESVFETQLQWSIDFDLPVVIHSRDAVYECLDILKKFDSNKLRGVFHSFGGTLDQAKEILAYPNFMLGINGTITFKNSTISPWLHQIDLSHLVIETDAPYLTPHPFRGKRNEPFRTVLMANKLAEIYKMSPDTIGQITTANARKLFQLQDID